MLGGVWTGWNSPAWAIQHAPINWGHVSWANQTFTRPERGWQKIERILERQKENVRRGAALTEATMRGFHYCPALLLLWAVCSVSDVQADVRTVKLCGREFIRAVVYTCGGSRWRRFSSPQDMKGEFAIPEIHADYENIIMCLACWCQCMK